MERNQHQLIQILEQEVSKLWEQYSDRSKQKIKTHFDLSLFSENFQTLDFYVQEINQTLQQLKNLSSDSLDYYQFLTEKLIAQCTALQGALKYGSSFVATPLKISKKLTIEEKMQQDIQRLPVKERVEKYKEMLQQLREEYSQTQNLLKNASNEIEKQQYLTLLESLQKQGEKYSKSSQLLEEYLQLKQQN